MYHDVGGGSDVVGFNGGGFRVGACGAVNGWSGGGVGFFVSENSGRASGPGLYCVEYDREYAGAWVGGDSAGLKAMEELAKLEDERGAAIKHVPMKNCNHKTEDKVEDKMEDRTEDKAEDQKVHRKSETGIASDEMCTFLIINISSLQLIPVNIIAYRSQYVSVNPTAIIVPGLIATVFSTVAAVIFCKIMCGKE